MSGGPVTGRPSPGMEMRQMPAREPLIDRVHEPQNLFLKLALMGAFPHRIVIFDSSQNGCSTLKVVPTVHPITALTEGNCAAQYRFFRPRPSHDFADSWDGLACSRFTKDCLSFKVASIKKPAKLTQRA
jgi:hypothetical protein